MADDVLTFEELRQVQSQERDSDTLQELDEAFFDRAENYLDLKKGGDDHLQNQEYRNAQNILEDILDMRQKKIVKLAFLAVKSGVTVDNMLPHEEDLFEDVKERISQYREQHGTVLQQEMPAEDADGTGTTDETGDADDAVDTAPETGTGVDDTGDSVPDTGDDSEDEEEESTGGEEPVVDADDADGGDTGEPGDETAADDILQFGDEEETAADSSGDGGGGQEAPGIGDTGEPEEEEEPAGEPDDREVEDEEDDGRVKVEVQERVPEFMGTDLEAYGPFEEGEEVEVPAKNADVLVQQGKAERA